jgi:hypothetical protein
MALKEARLYAKSLCKRPDRVDYWVEKLAEGM